MSKRAKLLKKLRNNPKDARINDLDTLVGYFGFVLLRITGSHRIYQYNFQGQIKQIAIPLHGSSVKVVYVKRVIDIIDQITTEDDVDGSDND
jgi:predicted RNA binding protein YcfA (HicA-like mRNA interferase family)